MKEGGSFLLFKLKSSQAENPPGFATIVACATYADRVIFAMVLIFMKNRFEYFLGAVADSLKPYFAMTVSPLVPSLFDILQKMPLGPEKTCYSNKLCRRA